MFTCNVQSLSFLFRIDFFLEIFRCVLHLIYLSVVSFSCSLSSNGLTNLSMDYFAEVLSGNTTLKWLRYFFVRLCVCMYVRMCVCVCVCVCEMHFKNNSRAISRECLEGDQTSQKEKNKKKTKQNKSLMLHFSPPNSVSNNKIGPNCEALARILQESPGLTEFE